MGVSALVLAALAVTAAPAPGDGFALRAAKVLVVSWDGVQHVDNGVVVVTDGDIAAAGPAATTPIPEGYEVRDVGERWLMPGMLDLHSHVGGTTEYNDMVFLTNPEIGSRAITRPGNANFQRALAAGVTTVLFIPGSGTNIGGQGILVKTGHDRYEEAVVRDPGSMKVAQYGNPERWAIGVGRAFENFHTRSAFRRGLAWARRWKASEEGTGEHEDYRPGDQIFLDLLEKRVQVSTHTQIAAVVQMTVTMIRREMGVDVFIDHGTIGGYLFAGYAAEHGVPAILGPRSLERTGSFRFQTLDTDGRTYSTAERYQAAGHPQIGFNTDAGVIPQEELALQATIAARHGFHDEAMQTVRGLTIVPARTAGIDHRVGSLEPGKDADILVITGHPADPRSSIEGVYLDGKLVYDVERDRRRF